MTRFLFTLEYDGKHHYEVQDQIGAEMITAETITRAVKELASKKKLRVEAYDLLADNSYRVFLYKRPLLKKPIKLVYKVIIEE
ncbi:hypothetical protein PU629_03155 [Pullulanibacillus sp. KACC 23026]|uniref:hypothetical protein n=1 Tax=Pullulanibacillus sp. KACC 23026 TaxID=3028315 RepID=UPI0023AFF311|nr:hypothetical protein [Pullulanibacillus sp. KACC 23026]WEG13380.1 hypothetical protein PU629_03155 [Pullulanibacillus sp. KACC 23026]